MRQRWDRLTFLHWRFQPADVARLLPDGLEVELFDGAAWVGLVPFYMRVATGRRTGTDIYALSLSGDRKPVSIVQNPFSNMQPRISPDGKWMAYSSNESGRFEVYLTRFPSGGAKWQVSTSGGSFPNWRRDNRELFLLDAADNVLAVEIQTAGNTVRMGTPQALFHAGGVQTQQGPYAVTADGKKFLINTGDVKEENQPFTLVQNWPAEIEK